MKVCFTKPILRRFYTYISICLVAVCNIQANTEYLSNLNAGLRHKNLNVFGAVLQQNIIIKGTITDADGERMPGVNVFVEGTSIGTITDLNGNYTIKVPNEQSVLVFSSMGYATQKVTIARQRNIDIKMAEDVKHLNEVVVTAMGIKREQKALGYAVSSISSKDITLAGPTNLGAALYGKATGVRVNSAPGGATSAVNIQIRGVTTIFGNTQPLYVVDGIPIRNHALLNYNNANNNTDYWNEQRIRENGILDINPEDIDNLTILKGASASALYGSDAGNGVVVITTKKGTVRKGMGVDFNYVYTAENLAFQPDYQNDYGPGYDRDDNIAITGNEQGWITDPDGSKHPFYRAYCQFGPKFDGQTVKYWDGSKRPYSANKNNYKDFFRTGYNSMANLAFSNASDKGSYRFSYTRNDYAGIQPGGKLEKNYFNFNGTMKLNDKLSIDLVSDYINSYTHNRPTLMSRIFGAYNGFFSRMDDMSAYYNKYQTSQGYHWVAYNQPYNDNEKLAYNIRATELMDFLWNQEKNSHDEYQNRFVNSATLNINLTNKIKLRGRLGNDFTSVKVEDKQYNLYPVSFGYSGSYGIQNGQYSLIYGDAMAIYTGKITKDLEFTLTGGITGKDDTYNDAQQGTSGGLVNENWFSINNSAGSFTTDQIKSSRKNQTYMAEFGMLSFNYKDWFFIEGTGRNEATSTLPPGNNTYFYPSINSGFVFSDAFHMPSFLNFGKLRASWGIVGNHPEMYKANVAYNQTSVQAATGTALYQYPRGSEYGNDAIKSEKKYETEIGLEARLFNYILGLDVSYYNNIIKNQILTPSVAGSSGATSMLTNIGDLTNQGIEIALTANPIKTKNFSWETRLNYSFNKNKLDRLADYLKNLEMYNTDGGSLIIKANVGDALGDIYVHPIETNEKGEKVVNEYGVYNIDYNNYVKVGNVMPKVTGGLSNSLQYKNFSLDFIIDYRFGGQLVSTPMYYMYGAGMFKNTLDYRDAAHGGISYNIDANNNKVASASGTYHDGVILDGVTSTGAKNTTIADAATYYMYSFGWGSGAGSYNRYEKAVFDNSYIKVREVTLNYTFSNQLVSKIGFQRLQFSLIGRNLFYIWKTLPNLDPEVGVGSNFLFQGIDQGSSAPTRSLGISLRASF